MEPINFSDIKMGRAPEIQRTLETAIYESMCDRFGEDMIDLLLDCVVMAPVTLTYSYAGGNGDEDDVEVLCGTVPSRTEVFALIIEMIHALDITSVEELKYISKHIDTIASDTATFNKLLSLLNVHQLKEEES